MSAVAGCFWFDRNAAADDLTPSTTCAAHRAGGPFHTWTSGPVALAAAPAPPVYDPVSQTTTIVDGIIDNLDDIATALGLPQPLAAVVARESVGKWGIDAGAHLLGDFVIIVYDERRRQLLAIRDPIGVRPLFYGTGARGVVIGSEAHQVVRHPAIPRVINEPMIAEALTDAPATLEETLWRNVYRVPAGCALEIDTGACVSAAIGISIPGTRSGTRRRPTTPTISASGSAAPWPAGCLTTSASGFFSAAASTRRRLRAWRRRRARPAACRRYTR